MRRCIVATVVALFVSGAVAAAAVKVDPDTGTGFAGKKDVQAALHMPGPLLRVSASAVRFRLLTVTTAEISWTCGYFPDPDGGPTQTRDQSESFRGTSAQRLSDRVARAGLAMTGFKLTGKSGEPVETAHWSGPEPGSPGFGACPDGWQVVSPPRASPSETTVLQVSLAGLHWADLQTLSP